MPLANYDEECFVFVLRTMPLQIIITNNEKSMATAPVRAATASVG